MRKLIGAELALTAVMSPSCVLAQSLLDRWDNLGQVRTGQRVEVVDRKMKAFQGQFVAYSRMQSSCESGRIRCRFRVTR